MRKMARGTEIVDPMIKYELKTGGEIPALGLGKLLKLDSLAWRISC